MIIIDECHRGSANDTSSWRDILTHFNSAVHLGLTATPKRDDNADTYKYFGDPIYEYSLKDGINDGFLTPYKVKRIKTNIDEKDEQTTNTNNNDDEEINLNEDEDFKTKSNDEIPQARGQKVIIDIKGKKLKVIDIETTYVGVDGIPLKTEDYLELLSKFYDDEDGLGNLVDLSGLGTVREVADNFGGIAQMRDEYFTLQKEIYK